MSCAKGGSNKTENDKQADVFWGDDPNILFQAAEFFPTNKMAMNRQLNAITRLIASLTLVLFSIFRQVHYIIIGAITTGCVWIVQHYYVHPLYTEAFDNQINDNDNQINETDTDADKVYKSSISSKLFQKPSPINPFGNVLLTDIVDAPNRLPAPPASNPIVMDEILQNTKQMIANKYPQSPDIVERMFGDMSEHMALEQSLRQWVSNPVTTIAGKSLAEELYGNTALYKDSLQR